MARFKMYVKAGSDGKSVGDCPFCQYALMVADLKAPKDQVEVVLVDFANKSKEFMDLNPAGTTPVMVDTSNDKVIADSQLIAKELEQLFPEPDLKAGYEGPALKACSGVFPKLVALLKNKTKFEVPTLRKALEDELTKLDSYLKSNYCAGPFILGENISALDCALLPKLHHVQVAGKHFQMFEIPESLEALHEYIKNGEASAAYQNTMYNDEDIIKGWARHGVEKVDCL